MGQKFNGNVFKKELPIRLGVIGYGERIAMDIIGNLERYQMNITPTAICDKNIRRGQEEIKNLRTGSFPDKVLYRCTNNVG